MTTILDLIPNPTEVLIKFKKLEVTDKVATYIYYDANRPKTDSQGNLLTMGAYVNDQGETVSIYVYDYVRVPVAIYDQAGNPRDIAVLEAEAAFAAIEEFQKIYINRAMEEYMVPDEVILNGNVFIV